MEELTQLPLIPSQPLYIPKAQLIPEIIALLKGSPFTPSYSSQHIPVLLSNEIKTPVSTDTGERR